MELFLPDNAGKIEDFFGKEKDLEKFRRKAKTILTAAANQVVDDRASIILALEDTPKNKKLVVEYLAANMMAAIKHDGGGAEPLVDMITDGLRDPRSQKVASCTLRNTNGSTITLEAIVRALVPPLLVAPVVSCSSWKGCSNDSP